MFTIIFGIIFLIVMIGASLFYFLVVKKGKKTKKTNRKKTSNETKEEDDLEEGFESQSAQEFLPFEDIEYDMILLGDHKYRAVIEVSSINYHLKTESEKEIIEIALNRFVNSLTHAISIFIQTRVLSHTKMISTLKSDLLKTVERYPNLETYANDYYNNMLNINKVTGKSKQKKKYIIVPFDESGYLEELNDQEKLEYAIKNIRSRVQVLISNLNTAGFASKMLNNFEIIELIYSTTNKDSIEDIDSIISGEFMTPVVGIDNDVVLGMTEEDRVDFILYEAQQRIKNEVLIKNLPSFTEAEFIKALHSLDKIRSNFGDNVKEALIEE